MLRSAARAHQIGGDDRLSVARARARARRPVRRRPSCRPTSFPSRSRPGAACARGNRRARPSRAQSVRELRARSGGCRGAGAVSVTTAGEAERHVAVACKSCGGALSGSCGYAVNCLAAIGRRRRGAIEFGVVAGGDHDLLPAGAVGIIVVLVSEVAGSGGDVRSAVTRRIGMPPAPLSMAMAACSTSRADGASVHLDLQRPRPLTRPARRRGARALRADCRRPASTPAAVGRWGSPPDPARSGCRRRAPVSSIRL